MISRFVSILIIFIFLIPYWAVSQEKTDSLARKQEVEGLISFYKYLLNTVGSSSTSVRDKEVIITQSYKKIFRDDDVQIEDDLDVDRSVVTNKNVRAYLQDVDFFFQNVAFEFEDYKIEALEGEFGQIFYKVSFTSQVEGTTLDGESFTKRQNRFVEINHDTESDDLRIVSVYTTGVNRAKELRLWWQSLSISWRELFLEKVPMIDSVSTSFLKQVTELDSLDLSGGSFFLDLRPVSELKKLKYLNISQTSILSLEPIRSLIKLKSLDASNTPISNLEYLKYCENLEVINLSKTQVEDLSPLQSHRKLKQIDLSYTFVRNYDPLKMMLSLQVINLSNSLFSDNVQLDGLVNLKSLNLANSHLSEWKTIALPQLNVLNLSNNVITEITSLKNLSNLAELYINNTMVGEISGLQNLTNLKKIYCNNTNVTDQQATDFMEKKPSCIVLVNGEALRKWWDALSENWQDVFLQKLKIEKPPTQDDLVRIVNIDSLDITRENLLDSNPIGRLTRLKYLDVSYNLFTDLKFLTNLGSLETFVGNGLPVDDLSPISNMGLLKKLELKSQTVNNIESLKFTRSLKLLNIDGNAVPEAQVIDLLNINPNILIIYKSDELLVWWENLDASWKRALKRALKFDGEPTSADLHIWIESEKLKIENTTIENLDALTAFVNLKSLTIQNCLISDFGSISRLNSLDHLEISGCPLMDLKPISHLKNLSSLNVSNTAITTLKPLVSLKLLKEINASGTNIKNLKGISELSRLERLNLSNTRIWKLERLYEIPTIREIICFNTRLRQHTIDEYKLLNPDCQFTFY